MRLLDATGRCLARYASPTGQATFEVPLIGVPTGLYVVEWDGGTGLLRSRLVVQ